MLFVQFVWMAILPTAEGAGAVEETTIAFYQMKLCPQKLQVSQVILLFSVAKDFSGFSYGFNDLGFPRDDYPVFSIIL